MSDAKKKKNRAISIGIVGLASIMGVATVGLVIGTALGTAPITNSNSKALDFAKLANDKLAKDGFIFANAKQTDNTIVISGDAANANDREMAFRSAKLEILEAAKGINYSGLVFQNAITINGDKTDELPDALTGLGSKPAEKECQSAYDILLSSHTINFNSGSAIIADDSKQLLTALAQIANRCLEYRVEIGGHTDSRGDAYANQTLSENRAQAVADFLFTKGVVKDQLAIKGYGETVPKDKSNSAEADAKNRRIEFKVGKKAE